MVQIGDALATREAHPDSPSTPGSQTDRLRHAWFWRGGGKQRPSYWKVGVGHSERRPSTWVGALSRAMASDVPGSAGKPEQVLQRAESVLPVQNRPISGRAPFWPTQGARRNLGVCVRLIRAVATRRACQSYTDRAFWAEPFWRLPPVMGMPAPECERCSDQIEPPLPRRGLRRLDRRVSRTQCECDHEASAPLGRRPA